MSPFRKLESGRIWVFIGLLVASVSFIRCKPIAPSILKNRYLRDASKSVNGTNSNASAQVNVVTKSFDDKKLFETELAKFSEGQKFVISEHLRSDALDELKENGFAEIHANFASGETLTAHVRVEMTDEDQAMAIGEAQVLESGLVLELRSLGNSTWVLAVSPQVSAKASAWNRARLIKVVLVSEATIQLPEPVLVE